MRRAPLPRNRVRVVPLPDGNFAVSTHEYIANGLFKLTGRHFCDSEGMAMLHAQRYAAMGYQLIHRDGGRP